MRPRMHATTGFFRGYCVLTTTFERRSLTTGGGTYIIQPSRPLRRSHSQCCCFAFLGAVIVINTNYLFLVWACVRLQHLFSCKVQMYVYPTKFDLPMHYTTTPTGFFLQFSSYYQTSSLRNKYCASFEICLGNLYFINLSYSPYINTHPKNNWRVAFKIHNVARFLL